jgi:hypothetical protein
MMVPTLSILVLIAGLGASASLAEATDGLSRGEALEKKEQLPLAGIGSSVARLESDDLVDSSGESAPSTPTGLTSAHNAARAAVSPAASPPLPDLVWSDEVAAVAQSWSDRCSFEHSQSKFGENIFASSGSATPQEVVDSWVREAQDYDYESNQCRNVCGHYTQVVWRDSTRLGCGVTSCTTGSPFGDGSWQLWVCNYDPPGNFNEQKPY